MSTLEALGLASIALTVACTWWAVRSGADPIAAIIEAWVNTCIGFGLNYSANPFLIPLMSPGGHMTAGSNFWGGCCYTAISVLRSFGIRLGLGAKIQRLAHRISFLLTTSL